MFYRGRAPHGQKSDWIMHEYRLEDSYQDTHVSNPMEESIQEEGWVVCRVFRKKTNPKSLESPKFSSKSKTNLNFLGSNKNEILDQILLYMGRNSESKNESLTQMNYINNNEGMIDERFLHLPRLDSSAFSCVQFDRNDEILENNVTHQQNNSNNNNNNNLELGSCSLNEKPELNDWATFDRLIASQLNGSFGLIHDDEIDVHQLS